MRLSSFLWKENSSFDILVFKEHNYENIYRNKFPTGCKGPFV
jgi:hypothetical protein